MCVCGKGNWCMCGEGDWCVCLGMSHNAGSQAALSYTSKQKNARHGRGTRSTASFSGLHSWVWCHAGAPGPPLPSAQESCLDCGSKQETRIQKPSNLTLFFPPAKRPVSPYSGYNGQLLTSVYQPTEMALMHKGPVSRSLRFP